MSENAEIVAGDKAQQKARDHPFPMGCTRGKLMLKDQGIESSILACISSRREADQFSNDDDSLVTNTLSNVHGTVTCMD